MKNKTKEISDVLNSLPEWNRWNNYKDNYDTEKITKSFLENVLVAEPGEKILDFGAGFAMNEYFAQDYNIKIDSLDIDTEEVRNTFKKVHEKLGLETYLYDGVKIPFEDNTFDKIIFKASLTKMVNSNVLNIFSELLRISKPEATWFVSPPYMIPRFIQRVVIACAQKWESQEHVTQLFHDLVSKRPNIISNDWVKRSTFAFAEPDMMVSPIGWISENTFDFDGLRMNYKMGYPKATTFYVNCCCLLMMMKNAFEDATNVMRLTTDKSTEIANHDFSLLKNNAIKNVVYIEDKIFKSRIRHLAKVSSRYDGKTYVLARGKSVGLIQDLGGTLKARKNDTVIYVNDWKKLLTRYEYSNFSEESINIHFLNRDIDLNKLSSRQYFDKTITLVQSNARPDERELTVKLDEHLYGGQQPYAMIPHMSIQEQVKTAGLHAVFYAVKVLKRKDIEIYGLDFFEANYFTEHVVSRKPEPQEYQPAKGKIAKDQFLKLVQENPDVNFKINTYADFSNAKFKNLTVNQLKE